MGTCEGRDNQNKLADLKKRQAIICTNSRLQQTNTQIEQRLENLLAKSLKISCWWKKKASLKMKCKSWNQPFLLQNMKWKLWKTKSMLQKKTLKGCVKQSKNAKIKQVRETWETSIENKQTSKNMPQQVLARILIQIIQPATATAHSISKAHTYCTDHTVIKTTVSSLCESFVKLWSQNCLKFEKCTCPGHFLII